MVLLGGLWLFVFNDGALCWGFPHFLPLIVLIPRGRVGGLGPDWVGSLYMVPAKLQMISPNSSGMSSDWNQAPLVRVVWFQMRRERGSVKSLHKLRGIWRYIRRPTSRETLKGTNDSWGYGEYIFHFLIFQSRE